VEEVESLLIFTHFIMKHLLCGIVNVMSKIFRSCAPEAVPARKGRSVGFSPQGPEKDGGDMLFGVQAWAPPVRGFSFSIAQGGSHIVTTPSFFFRLSPIFREAKMMASQQLGYCIICNGYQGPGCRPSRICRVDPCPSGLKGDMPDRGTNQGAAQVSESKKTEKEW
jgi:hypothetical protein